MILYSLMFVGGVGMITLPIYLKKKTSKIQLLVLQKWMAAGMVLVLYSCWYGLTHLFLGEALSIQGGETTLTIPLYLWVLDHLKEKDLTVLD